MNIRKKHIFVITLHRLDQVVRMRSERINWHAQHHAAYFEIRIDLMTDFYRQSTCNELMVNGLIQILLTQFLQWSIDSATHKWEL
ncbi:hypothetical protein D3C75_560380 [compost metagenome]